MKLPTYKRKKNFNSGIALERSVEKVLEATVTDVRNYGCFQEGI